MQVVPPSVKNYRELYRKDQHKTYSVFLHWSFVLLLCGGLVSYCLTQLSRLQFWELFSVPVAFLVACLVEYGAHRFWLHRKIRWFNVAYQEHTEKHHSFFTNEALELEGPADMQRVLFPWYGILFFIGVIATSLAYIVATIFTVNVGWLFLATTTSYFFLYELVHLICHLPDEHPFLRWNRLKERKEHHRLHHHQSLMARSHFGIVTSLFDGIFKTKLR
jgi:hypothetical protein